MRIIYALMLLGVTLLAACATVPQSAPTPEEPRSLASSVAQPAETPTPQEAEPTLEGKSLVDSNQTETENSLLPEVAWESSPETQIVSATHCCGFVPEEVMINYIPEAQVFGDGRIIWTQISEDGQRSVLEGTLSTQQIEDLLQQAVDYGFFGWEELYTSPLSPSDLPSQCLFIRLADLSRRVCEYYEGAPEEFHQLYETLKSGAGASSTEYVPEKGYVVARTVPTPDWTVPAWDAGTLGFSLSQASEGAWIDGEALEAAWSLVNQNPGGGVVQEGDAYYQITLQIPGVSMEQPPAP